MIQLWDNHALFLYKILNGQVRLVGGCVRDYLCSKPFQDRDMATTLTPDKVVHLLEKANIPYVDIGKDFGTIIAKVDGVPFEITTLRKDIKTDGRHAVVVWAKRWSTDAKRRDFTINALYADVDGKIWDYVGGLDDLKHHILRFIGDPNKRIKEDYLRILRYFRFFSIMEQRVVPSNIQQAIQQNQQGLYTLSMDRRRDEMFKLICTPYAENTLQVMDSLGVLQSVLTHIPFSKRQLRYIRDQKLEKMLAKFDFFV